MLSQIRLPTLIIMLLSFFAATGVLASPTWDLGMFTFRCKPPYVVESFASDWNEWRVSSVCAPGTCCSNWANTGPLCTAEACKTAERERTSLTMQYNREVAQKKQEKEAEEERNKEQKTKEAEAMWKLIEANEELQEESLVLS